MQAEEKAENSCLIELVKNKLTEYGLLGINDQINLIPWHFIEVGGFKKNHYIIECSDARKKFFLKLYKENDSLFHCNKYIEGSTINNDTFYFPIILVPPFEFFGDQFYITAFIEGEDLDALNEKLSVQEWKRVAIGVRNRISELSAIHAANYSERNNFTTDNYAQIITSKIKQRINHPVLNNHLKNKIEIACKHCFEILNSAIFSEPTLIHMDIKPANIVYNTTNGLVSLIDFEFARFGDFDYGMVQIMLTKYNSFSDTYREHVYPELIKEYMPLERAMTMPKLQVYIFYQTLCNLIYYDDRNIKCPHGMNIIFESTLEILSKE